MSGWQDSGRARRFCMMPVFLITALLAACGGGGGSSDSDPASPEPSNRAPRAVLEGPARLTAGTEGAFRLTAEDDDGRTGLQLAAAGGFAEALQTLIESVRKAGQPSDLEEVDDDGRTPLMIAAHAGKLGTVLGLSEVRGGGGAGGGAGGGVGGGGAAERRGVE